MDVLVGLKGSIQCFLSLPQAIGYSLDSKGEIVELVMRTRVENMGCGQADGQMLSHCTSRGKSGRVIVETWAIPCKKGQSGLERVWGILQGHLGNIISPFCRSLCIWGYAFMPFTGPAGSLELPDNVAGSACATDAPV